MVVKPLGLPVGSVRALLLLGLGACGVLALRRDGDLPAWLGTALVIAAAAYFSSRSAMNAQRAAAAGGGEVVPRPRHPLGLPAGTVRLMFLAAVGYGAWLWFHQRAEDAARLPVVWILAAFALGIVMRWILTRVRPEDVGARFFDHLLALIALLALGGLLAIAITGRPEALGDWSQPLLAAIVVHYFASR